MPRPFAVIGFTVFFTIAILFKSDIGVTLGFLAVYAVALTVSLINPSSRKQRVMPCAFASGIIACILLITEIAFYYQPSVDYDGKTCNVSAQFTDYPEYRYGNYYFDAKTLEIDGEKVEHKLRLVFSSFPDAEPFDIVNGEFTFYVLGSSSEDFLASNKANGVFIGAYPNDGIYEITRVPENEKPFMKFIVEARRSINNAISKSVPGESGALASALIIGDKSYLSDNLQSDFRLSGITHIICVSGFHLSLWAMIILEVLKFFKVKEKIASVVSAFGVVMFMLIAGMTYSVLRSGIMMLLYLMANVIWKKRDSLNSLGFAMTAIAVYNPFAMGSVGLQLSALSSLGLILFSQNIKPKTDDFISRIDNEWLVGMLKPLITALCVPIVASLFTLPVSMGLYDEFNFAVFASNLIAVPVASLCIFSGAIAAVFSGFVPSIPNIFAFSTDFFASLLIKIARIFGDFDLLTFRADSDTHRIMICGIFLVCALSAFIAYAGKNVFRITCVLCAFILVFGLLTSSVTIDYETRITVVDVGNGSAVFISKDGENMLIGCGGTAFSGAEKISDVIVKNSGKIDTLIIPDDDDFSSAYLNKILLSYRPSRIWFDDLPSGSNLLLGGCETHGFSDEIISENFSCIANGQNVIYLENEDVSVLICFNPVFDYSSLPDEFKNADVIISRNDYPQNVKSQKCRLLVVNSENTRGLIIQNELSVQGIKAVATGGCGNILIRAENGFVSANRTE